MKRVHIEVIAIQLYSLEFASYHMTHDGVQAPPGTRRGRLPPWENLMEKERNEYRTRAHHLLREPFNGQD